MGSLYLCSINKTCNLTSSPQSITYNCVFPFLEHYPTHWQSEDEKRPKGRDWKVITSILYLLDAHVQDHGPWCIVGFNQRGEVTAENLLDAPQVWLAVAGHQLGALLMHIQTTVYKGTKVKRSQGNHPSVSRAADNPGKHNREVCIMCVLNSGEGWKQVSQNDYLHQAGW